MKGMGKKNMVLPYPLALSLIRSLLKSRTWMRSQRNWTVSCPGGATPAVCIEGQSSRNTKGTVRFWEREMPEASWKIYWNSERESEKGEEKEECGLHW